MKRTIYEDLLNWKNSKNRKPLVIEGAFTEQYVAQEYICHNTNQLYYYTNTNSTLELNFVFQKDSVCIVEVKAEENLRSKSLMTTLNSNDSIKGYRFSMADYRQQGRMENVPLYLIGEYTHSL